MIRSALIGVWLLAPPALAGQTKAARPEDVTTLDGIITAYYDVVSGPAGSLPDPARDHSLHHPNAAITLLSRKPDGTATAEVVTLDEYYRRMGSGPRKVGFYEHEIHRAVEKLGALTHVWSTYETSETPSGPAKRRGINSIELYWDGSRYWILSWVFDDERHGLQIPRAYLP